MKHILFVDDEPLVLQGLERMLRPMREKWEMRFVASGAQALAAMAATPADVVVADMRMPGMDGAQLLKEIMRSYPATVRLILSGFTEKNVIARCVGVAHQYLAKPCEPATLQATIERVTNLEHTLQAGALQRLVGRLERLPSLPALYTEILQCLQNPNADLADVGALIAHDLGMAAKVLKLVNSAFFGLPQPIANPAEAVLYLGLDNVKSVVLAAKTFGQFQEIKVPGFDADALWQHSLHTAGAAQRIARQQHGLRAVAEQAFVAGLLHDVGKLILATNLREQYTALRPPATGDDRPMWEIERGVFGASHADVGGYLLGLWGLPAPVVEAIALHHYPAIMTGGEFAPLKAVHVANAFAHHTAPRADEGIDLDYLKQLGVDGNLEEWRALCQQPAPQPEIS